MMLALHNTSITAAYIDKKRETKCDSLIEEMEKGRTNITFSRLVVRANPCQTTKFGLLDTTIEFVVSSPKRLCQRYLGRGGMIPRFPWVSSKENILLFYPHFLLSIC